MRMTLSELEFIRLLPQFMREDDAIKGLSLGLNNVIPQLSHSVERLTTWDQIDNLSEAELDELAWELNILWYIADANIEAKRDVIKNSDKVYQHLGTKWAVERVISSYFGDGKIVEWWEYGGEPGHFSVETTNPTVTQERLTEFLSALNKTKRATAKLDNISITLTAQMGLYAAAAVHEVGNEQYAIGTTALA